jgi:hypothetical protein
MVAHDDVADELPVVADDRLLETVDQPTSARIIADDLLPGVVPRHHVINWGCQTPFFRTSVRVGNQCRQSETHLSILQPPHV